MTAKIKIDTRQSKPCIFRGKCRIHDTEQAKTTGSNILSACNFCYEYFIAASNLHKHFVCYVTKHSKLSFVEKVDYVSAGRGLLKDKDRLKAARKKTGLDCGMMVVSGSINNIKITAVASDFDFLGASMAAAEGEAFLYGVQHAIENQTPFLCVSAGGGMRMMESLISLSQMTRTTLAINELKKNNLPYLVCFTDPTAGGITASFAMLGDVQFSEPGALIAFAGRRVVQATVKEELPVDFQTAEFLLKHGFVDRIVERKNLSKEIGLLLSILLKKNSAVNSENNEKTSELSTQTREAS